MSRVILLCLFMAGTANGQTLGTLLAENGVRPGRDSARLLARQIHSYATAADSGHFIVAYLRAAGPLPDSLYIAVFGRNSEQVRHVALQREPGVVSVAAARGTTQRTTLGIGSPTEIAISPTHYFLDTHRTPAAGTVLVLSKDLSAVAALDGWVELLLPGGAALYQKSTVHFAPTHPAELWLYDPASARHALLYPTLPYEAVRQLYIERVREIYARLGDDWFRLNNHHMMAEQFESRIGTPMSDSSGTRIAFIAMFGEGGGTRAATPLVEVLVVCDSIQTAARCTEEELSATRVAHPDWSNDRILRDALSRRE